MEGNYILSVNFVLGPHLPRFIYLFYPLLKEVAYNFHLTYSPPLETATLSR